ncbi:MAG TPA: VOC family protein [Kaistia sp.]|nr:VOC family protein [Kaistia sp.]
MGGARPGPVVIPSLRARNLAETIAFYGQLGFQVRAAFPCVAEAQWCALVRDGLRLHFHVMDLEGQSATPGLSGTLYVSVDDVRALAEEWRPLVPFTWGPEVMPYGWREFAIRDPNGYTIGFFEETSDPPDCPAA